MDTTVLGLKNDDYYGNQVISIPWTIHCTCADSLVDLHTYRANIKNVHIHAKKYDEDTV